MKNSPQRNRLGVCLVTGLRTFVAGIAAILWLVTWYRRLMPRVLGGQGAHAWFDLANRGYHALRRDV